VFLKYDLHQWNSNLKKVRPRCQSVPALLSNYLMQSYSRSMQRPYLYGVNSPARRSKPYRVRLLYVDEVNSGLTKVHRKKQIYRKKMRKKNPKSEIQYTSLVKED